MGDSFSVFTLVIIQHCEPFVADEWECWPRLTEIENMEYRLSYWVDFVLLVFFGHLLDGSTGRDPLFERLSEI